MKKILAYLLVFLMGVTFNHYYWRLTAHSIEIDIYYNCKTNRNLSGEAINTCVEEILNMVQKAPEGFHP